MLISNYSLKCEQWTTTTTVQIYFCIKNAYVDNFLHAYSNVIYLSMSRLCISDIFLKLTEIR